MLYDAICLQERLPLFSGTVAAGSKGFMWNVAFATWDAATAMCTITSAVWAVTKEIRSVTSAVWTVTSAKWGA